MGKVILGEDDIEIGSATTVFLWPDGMIDTFSCDLKEFLAPETFDAEKVEKKLEALKRATFNIIKKEIKGKK